MSALSYDSLLFSKILFEDNRLFIFEFTAVGNCLIIRLGWLELILIYEGMSLFLLKGL